MSAPETGAERTDSPYGRADDERLRAAIELVGHTGAETFQLRYSDDEHPVVWMAVAGFTRGEDLLHQVAGGLTPRQAAFRLCEALLDGAACTHCQRPSGVTEDFSGDLPLETRICWYRYDPERRTYRRGCEGDAP